MTVDELRKILDTLPNNTEIEFIGYAQGREFIEKAAPSDFVYDKWNSALMIKTDWN
jgi:hypothetical protein